MVLGAKGTWGATWGAFFGGAKLAEFGCPGYELWGKHPPPGGPRGGSGLEKVKLIRNYLCYNISRQRKQ